MTSKERKVGLCTAFAAPYGVDTLENGSVIRCIPSAACDGPVMGRSASDAYTNMLDALDDATIAREQVKPVNEMTRASTSIQAMRMMENTTR